MVYSVPETKPPAGERDRREVALENDYQATWTFTLLSMLLLFFAKLRVYYGKRESELKDPV